jgi:hypothetical protein
MFLLILSDQKVVDRLFTPLQYIFSYMLKFQLFPKG